MLRKWQKECIEGALKTYLYQTHYLVLASPGAGKTVAAASIAKSLIDTQKIDYIVCFSPSRIVAESIENTFEHILERKFNGRLGAIGSSRTYHSLLSASELIDDLSQSRVLVVFDEIHHCAGNDESQTNAWGMQLLATIQHLATYTLSLTGTPWRTDMLPISFARYSDPEGNILCDFSYGLAEAISDGVCRLPNITAIDIEKVMVKGADGIDVYTCIKELMSEGNIAYQSIISHPEAIKYILKLGIEKLDLIRYQSPNAGGLIVASSYEHALQIKAILSGHFQRSSTLVSCRNEDSSELIQQFRQSRTEWIISIAMISEGTDIPRLQVCCHLTDITTELYFRQILGRIIRMTKNQTDNAYMYMLAEPNLTFFAERLSQDIPNSYTYQKSQELMDSICENNRNLESFRERDESTLTNENSIELKHFDENLGLGRETLSIPELVMSKFKSRIIASFLH